MRILLINADGIVENIIEADCSYAETLGYRAEKADDYPQFGIGDVFSDQPSVESARESKLSEVGAACESAIYAGVEVDGKHYSLTGHDQIEIMAQQAAIQAGAKAVTYHADGELCRPYSAAEFMAVARAATNHIFYHRTYCNHLNAWIRRAKTAEEIAAITYGTELPDDLAAHMAEILGQEVNHV